MEYITLVILVISIFLLLFVLKKMGELKKDFASLHDDVDVKLKELFSDNKKNYANILNSVFEMIKGELKPAETETYDEDEEGYEEGDEDVPEEYEDDILELFENKKRIRNDDVQDLLGVSDATATRYLDKLEDKVLIVQKGEGRKAYYERLPT